MRCDRCLQERGQWYVYEGEKLCPACYIEAGGKYTLSERNGWICPYCKTAYHPRVMYCEQCLGGR